MKKSLVSLLLMMLTITVYAQEERSFSVNGVTFKMKYVQGGTFTMGATKEQGSEAEEKEKPAHNYLHCRIGYVGHSNVRNGGYEPEITDKRSNP